MAHSGPKAENIKDDFGTCQKSREKLKPKTISIRYIKGTQETTTAPRGLTWNILSNNNKKIISLDYNLKYMINIHELVPTEINDYIYK